MLVVKLVRFRNSNNKKGYIYILTRRGIEKSRITRTFFQKEIRIRKT